MGAVSFEIVRLRAKEIYADRIGGAKRVYLISNRFFLPALPQ